jgi:hypothetical protein
MNLQELEQKISRVESDLRFLRGVLDRNNAAIVSNKGIGGDLFIDGNITLPEKTAPDAPLDDSVVIYAVDNGAGKTQLMARFATGAVQQIAIEP